MEVLGVDHIGIAVNDLNAALDFYTNTLGLPAGRVEERPDLGLRLARVRLGDVELELIEASDWERTMQRYLPQKGPGVYHVGLRVGDVDAAVAELDAAHVPVIDRTPRAGDAMRVAFLHPDAAGGTLLELVTRTDGASLGSSARQTNVRPSIRRRKKAATREDRI